MALQIASNRKWSTKDQPEWQGWMDALPLPIEVLEELKNGDNITAYIIMSELDRCLWKYNLAIRSVDGEPMFNVFCPDVFEEMGGWRTFVDDTQDDDPCLFLGLANKIL